MPNSIARLFFVLLAASLQVHAHDAESQARYLGNEGVLIEHGDVKVLFDAFYANSYDRYVLVAPGTSAALQSGEPPYESVDAVFVSHIHGDHFSVEPTLAYLRAQSEVQLFASKQVTDALTRAAQGEDDPILKQLTPFDLEPGNPPVSITLGEVQIEVVAIPHSGGARMSDVSNLAFRVTLHEGPTVLHMGDADVDDAHYAPLQSYWDARTTHIAFPPYWFFANQTGVFILQKRIKALHNVGIHVPSEAIGHAAQWREKAQGDLFTDPGETRIIPTGEKKP